MTNFKKVFFTTKQFNNLIGGNNRTLKDLYNYNHLKPAKIAADTKQMFYTCYESETISNKIMQENFNNIQCIIIFNDFIAGWNGIDFKKADLRTCCKSNSFTKADLKKRIAASNKNNEIKYICVCCIEYDRTWYDKKYNGLYNPQERVPFNRLKTYCKNYGGTSFLQSGLEGGGIIEIYPDTPSDDFSKSIDKSGYLRKPAQEKYKKILAGYNENRDTFAKSFIKESRDSYFNIAGELCYHLTTPLQYFLYTMKKLHIKTTCRAAGLSYEAETKKFRFSWCEESFILVLKEQPKNKSIKYYHKDIFITLNFYMADTLTHDLLKEIKNLIHSNKLIYLEGNEGLTACDSYIYNTCYEMNNIKVNPTFTEENGKEKIIEISFIFDISKNNNIKYFDYESHEKTKKFVEAVTL